MLVYNTPTYKLSAYCLKIRLKTLTRQTSKDNHVLYKLQLIHASLGFEV